MDAPDLTQRLFDATTAVAGLDRAWVRRRGAGCPGWAAQPHRIQRWRAPSQTSRRSSRPTYGSSSPRSCWPCCVSTAAKTRTLGDLLIAGLTAASTINVGVELGRWQGQLLPYIPQLPIELAALAVGVAAWLVIRAEDRPGRMLVALAGACVALVVTAGAVETWWTPHRQTTTATTATDHSRSVSPRREGLVAGADVRRLGPSAARSHAPFPSRSSVPPRPPAAVFSFINQPTPTKEPPPR